MLRKVDLYDEGTWGVDIRENFITAPVLRQVRSALNEVSPAFAPGQKLSIHPGGKQPGERKAARRGGAG